jgi:hypothetical protein
MSFIHCVTQTWTSNFGNYWYRNHCLSWLEIFLIPSTCYFSIGHGSYLYSFIIMWHRWLLVRWNVSYTSPMARDKAVFTANSSMSFVRFRSCAVPCFLVQNLKIHGWICHFIWISNRYKLTVCPFRRSESVYILKTLQRPDKISTVWENTDHEKDDPTDFPNRSSKLQKLASYPWWLGSFDTYIWYEIYILYYLISLRWVKLVLFFRWLLIFINGKVSK